MAKPNGDLTLENAAEWYNWLLAQGNPRVRGWFLMNPLHVLGLIGAYLLVILILVKVMARREKPYKMKGWAIVHNVQLAVLSLYMCVETVRQAIVNDYSLWGNAVDDGPAGEGMARVLHIFFLSKILEFGDTVLMALKKNFHQISFLHLYHHTSIFAIWWVIVYYAPGGEGYFSAALNSFIHVLMYSYYLWTTLTSDAAKKNAAALAPGAKPPKPTWREPGYYKEWMTRMQLIQFCTMFAQATYDIIVPSKYPAFCCHILFYYMMTMLALFGNFYVKAYLSASKKAAERKAAAAAAAAAAKQQ